MRVLIVNLGCELLDQSVNLSVRAKDTFLTEQGSDAGTDVLALLGGKENCGTGAYDSSADEGVKYRQIRHNCRF